MNVIPTIGIIANPASGRDIRRLIASAPTATLQEKYTIVRRVVIGAAEAGVKRMLFLREPHRISERAIETLDLGLDIQIVDIDSRFDESDTIRTSAAMAEAGCSAIVTLGGDGTNRAVALGWRDATLMPISTGTNNVFPQHIEATVAGHAAGLVATRAVPHAVACRRAKVVEVTVEGEPDDLALIDAVLLDERFVGSRALFAPDALRLAVLARSEAASVGIASIGGALVRSSFEDDHGVAVRFSTASPGTQPPGTQPPGTQSPGTQSPGSAQFAQNVRAPLAPGRYEPFSIEHCAPIQLDEVVHATGPGVLAFDGERQRVLADGQHVTFRVARRGPWVIEPTRTLNESIQNRARPVN